MKASSQAAPTPDGHGIPSVSSVNGFQSTGGGPYLTTICLMHSIAVAIPLPRLAPCGTDGIGVEASIVLEGIKLGAPYVERGNLNTGEGTCLRFAPLME